MERQKLQRAADTAVSILKENLKDYTFCFPVPTVKISSTLQRRM